MIKCVYFIQETATDKNGEYIPCIARQGETGYYLTDWHWGKDRAAAEWCCDEKNAALGISKREAIIIVLQSMR